VEGGRILARKKGSAEFGASIELCLLKRVDVDHVRDPAGGRNCLNGHQDRDFVGRKVCGRHTAIDALVEPIELAPTGFDAVRPTLMLFMRACWVGLALATAALSAGSAFASWLGRFFQTMIFSVYPGGRLSISSIRLSKCPIAPFVGCAGMGIACRHDLWPTNADNPDIEID
jgi:hypothetical protein